MNPPKDTRFNWSQSFGRDRFYTQYKPKVKIYSFFFLILPWFNLFLLAFAYVYFSHALCVVPGEKVQLPIAKDIDSGLNSGFIITARPLYSRDAEVEQKEPIAEESEEVKAMIGKALPEMIVFFQNERFNLSLPHRYASFEAKLREESKAYSQKNALIYADRNIVLGDSMKLMDILRNAGLEEICIVEDVR